MFLVCYASVYCLIPLTCDVVAELVTNDDGDLVGVIFKELQQRLLYKHQPPCDKTMTGGQVERDKKGVV